VGAWVVVPAGSDRLSMLAEMVSLLPMPKRWSRGWATRPLRPGASTAPVIAVVDEREPELRGAASNAAWVIRMDAARPARAAAAMLELARPWIGACTVVSASRILQVGFGRWLLERMLADPSACARAFNAALARAPRAARPLRLAGDRSELPVWLLGPAGERIRATADDVRAAMESGTPVLPRAFPMSVVARTALTDRFVHGLGGGVYEQATDHWMQTWLGWTPPPHDVVSASLRLDMPVPAEVGGATMPWRRAWCDPELLHAHGAGPSPARRGLLDRIAALPVGDPGRRRAYRDLIEARNAGRVDRAMELESLRQAELVAARSRQSRELAARRTWCFALHPPEAISRLQAALRAAR